MVTLKKKWNSVSKAIANNPISSRLQSSESEILVQNKECGIEIKQDFTFRDLDLIGKSRKVITEMNVFGVIELSIPEEVPYIPTSQLRDTWSEYEGMEIATIAEEDEQAQPAKDQQQQSSEEEAPGDFPMGGEILLQVPKLLAQVTKDLYLNYSIPEPTEKRSVSVKSSVHSLAATKNRKSPTVTGKVQYVNMANRQKRSDRQHWLKILCRSDNYNSNESRWPRIVLTRLGVFFVLLLIICHIYVCILEIID